MSRALSELCPAPAPLPLQLNETVSLLSAEHMPARLEDERAQVAAVCRRWVEATLLQGGAAAVGLRRIVLLCLIDLGVAQPGGSAFDLQPVELSLLGSAVTAAISGECAAVRQLYRSPGHKLGELLADLQRDGLVRMSRTKLSKLAALRTDRLQQAAPAAPPPPTAAGSARSVSVRPGATVDIAQGGLAPTLEQEYQQAHKTRTPKLLPAILQLRSAPPLHRPLAGVDINPPLPSCSCSAGAADAQPAWGAW